MRHPAREVLQLTAAGLYCPVGDFFIDPTRKVERAVITHGHADHARSGHHRVLATAPTLAFMAARYGANYCGSSRAVVYGETVRLGEVAVTLYPAGHVLGSAQVAVDSKGLRIVISGDYKRQTDPTCDPFEVIDCNIFVSEATFALPVYRFPPAATEIGRLLGSLAIFAERPHYVGAYSLGKAQRVIGELRGAGYDAPIHVPPAVEDLCAVYADHGVDLGRLAPLDPGAHHAACLVIGAMGPADGARDEHPPIRSFASGWTRVRSRSRQPGTDLPLIISDHADWQALCQTAVDTGADEIWFTHGDGTALLHWATQHDRIVRSLESALGAQRGEQT